MRSLCLLALVCVLAVSAAGADFFPLEDVKPGLQGVGRTVFSGESIEEFDVEVLGVLKNVGPKQSLILVRLSGGKIAETGVSSGMSGSPVYFDGKLAGAVAFSFAFSSEPIAGVRPIADMVVASGDDGDAVARSADGESLLASLERPDQQPEWLLPPGPSPIGRDPQLVPIATPLAMAGFSERTLDLFGPVLEKLGLRPMQGVGGQLTEDESTTPPAPGSMISVGLIRGDLDLSAAGTVTHVEGDRLYAFGHRFLSSGPTELPMMRASVVTVVPNLNTSFKIAGSGEMLGKVVLDRNAGIAGVLGENPQVLPLRVGIRSAQGSEHDYQMELVEDPFLSPFLLQMALFSAIDATERSVGPASYRVSGAVEFSNGLPPLQLDNMYSAPSMTSFQLATSTGITLAFLMQSGLGDAGVRDIHLEIDSAAEEKSLEIDRVWASRTRVRPGETVRLSAALRSQSGQEIIRSVDYRVPPGMQFGPLNITFSDANSLNLMEWQALAGGGKPGDLPELVRAINRLRRNDQLYVRLWRPGRAVRVNAEQLPAPPASVAGVLSLPAAAGARNAYDWQSVLEEFAVDGLGSVVKGNISMRVTITE